jgi:DNA-binding HxlR family transcriptional regulator
VGGVADACDQAVEALTSVFALLGKRWTGLILAVLMPGPAHYAELRRAVPGISERMLSSRLSELVVAELVIREVVEGPPLGVRYRVTPKGAALRPAMEELARWAEEHFAKVIERRGCLTDQSVHRTGQAREKAAQAGRERAAPPSELSHLIPLPDDGEAPGLLSCRCQP